MGFTVVRVLGGWHLDFACVVCFVLLCFRLYCWVFVCVLLSCVVSMHCLCCFALCGRFAVLFDFWFDLLLLVILDCLDLKVLFFGGCCCFILVWLFVVYVALGFANAEYWYFALNVVVWWFVVWLGFGRCYFLLCWFEAFWWVLLFGVCVCGW